MLKTPVAVAMVVCGTLLVCMPFIQSMVGTVLVYLLMQQSGESASLNFRMPWYSDAVVMVGGLIMIFIAAHGAVPWGKKDGAAT